MANQGRVKVNAPSWLIPSHGTHGPHPYFSHWYFCLVTNEQVKAGASNKCKLRIKNTGATAISGGLLVLDISDFPAGSIGLSSQSREAQRTQQPSNTWRVNLAPNMAAGYVIKVSVDDCTPSGNYVIRSEVQVPATATTPAFVVDTGTFAITVTKGFKGKFC